MDQLSRVGLLGDVHACDGKLESALRFLRAQNVERILCVGDIVDGFGDGERCCALLQQFGVATVRGNHDRWLLNHEMRDLEGAVACESLSLRAFAFLQSLPPTLNFETTRGPLLLCHGVGDNDMNKLTPDDYGYALECNDELQTLIAAREYRFVVGGHTHRRMVKRFGPLTFINAGALPAGNEPCFALADFEREVIEFRDFDGDEVAGISENFVL